MKIVFPGSFDPLTNGHKKIILKALRIFESVNILILNKSIRIQNQPAMEYLPLKRTSLELLS